MRARFGLLVAAALLVHVGSASADQPRDFRGNCTDAGCHDEYTKRPVVHGPVAQGACDGCHEPEEGETHKFSFPEEGADLCAECHDSHEGKVTHAPAADGQCDACHDPHGSKTKGLLLADTQSELCVGCHDEILEDMTFLHGPVAAGACTACHDPHASSYAKLLSAEGRALCVRCHTSIAERTSNKKYIHSPVKEGCVACHNPHGAKNKMMLAATMPDMCVDCHDDIGELIEDATVQHSPMKDAKSCARCHDPHGSDIEHVLVRQPMDICLSCHDREYETNTGKIGNIASELREKTVHHGPIDQKDCAGCHAVHGGENRRLLMGAFPDGFYVSFESEKFELCFECHDAELVEEDTTDDATNFRNGDRNLHYVHVNRQVKGRTCRACHQMHASSLPKLIAEEVPFGAWKIPIQFEQTGTGGGCQPGCHRPYRYDREKPVQNLSKS